MNDLVLIYTLFAILVGVLKTITYYRSHIRYHKENSSRKQIRDAVILTLAFSVVVAPLVIIDFVVDTFKRKGKTYE